MLQKFACAFICMALLLIPGYAGAATNEEWPHDATMTVEKTFKKDGLRFQVTISNRTQSEGEPTLFTINTKVTNTSNKPIPYVQTVCEDVRSSVTVHIPDSDKKYPLSSPDDLACPPMTQDKELLAGQTIAQEEQFTTAFLPIELSSTQGLYTLRSSLLTGSEEVEGKNISFDTSFDDRVSLPTQSLRVDASLTKISNKYQLVVKGTTNVTQVKSLYLRIGKSKYSLIMNKKTQKLSLSKRISIKGNPPETGKLEISCADGTYYYLNIPIQLASTK